VTVTLNGRDFYSGTVKRQAAGILVSLGERADATATATAIVTGK
jgi:hypothetical protein